MKPLQTSPELLRKLADSRGAWDRMTTEKKEDMIRKQQESWARQDMD
jgi:hypothetical protein